MSLLFWGNSLPYSMKFESHYFPTGSGLSSSAAFVCSSMIAIMAAYDVSFPKVFYAFF